MSPNYMAYNVIKTQVYTEAVIICCKHKPFGFGDTQVKSLRNKPKSLKESMKFLLVYQSIVDPHQDQTFLWRKNTSQPRTATHFLLSYRGKLIHWATNFYKLNLCNTYNLVQIREGDKWKIGYDQYQAMLFTADTPAVFQNLTNNMLRDRLNEHIFVYF